MTMLSQDTARAIVARITPEAATDDAAYHDDQPCRDCADFAVDGVCPNSGKRCWAQIAPEQRDTPTWRDGVR